MLMKTILLFRRGLFLALILIYQLSCGQLFTQDFESSANLSTYVNSTSPTNEQFNAIGTSGAGTVVSINANKLRFARSGTNAGSYSRTLDFFPTPTSLIYQFDITVSGNSSAETTAAIWQVGSGYGLANNSEDLSKTHSRIGLNIGAISGQFSLRNISSTTNSATFSGKQTVTWYINNSGSSLTYTAPDATTQTVLNDTFDVWVDNLLVFKDVPVSTATVDLKNLKFVFTAGTANIDLDNIRINPFPSNSPRLATGGIGTLSGFAYNEGSGPSLSQFFNLSGSNLSPTSGNITVTPPASYEISSDGIAFTSSAFSIPYSSGSISESPATKIHVRLKAGLLVNTYNNESVIVSGGGAPSVSVICSGFVTKPTIVLGTLTSTVINYPLGSGPSSSANATVAGSNLTGNISIVPSDINQWEVSKDNLTWTSSTTYIPTGGMVSSSGNKIYLRLKTGLPVGNYAGTLTASSPTAFDKTISFTGEVLKPTILINSSPQNINLSGFTYDFAQGPSSTQSFRVDGTALSGNVAVSASFNWEISSNASYDGSNVSPYSTVVLTKSMSNEVNNKLITIRLKNGLAVGAYSGIITITSPEAETRIINVLGQVYPPKVEMKVTGGTGTITNGSVTPSSLNRTLFAAQKLGDSQTKMYTITNKGGADLVLGDFSVTGLHTADFSILNPPEPATILMQGQSLNFEIKFSPTTVGLKTAVILISNNDQARNPFSFTIAGNANFCGASAEIIIAQQGFEEIPAYADLPYTISNSPMYGVQTGFSTGKSTSADQPSSNNLFSEGARGFRIQGGTTPNTSLVPLLLNFAAIDTSIYSNIDLSLRVAGFSVGSTTNGMDHFDVLGGIAATDAEKIDFILIEISPDDGLTWYQQAKVVSDDPNLVWSFGSVGTTAVSKTYMANNTLTYFKSNLTTKYSTVLIKNVPSVPNLKIRISAQNNNDFESWILDDIKLVSTGLVPKVWNGTTWSPSDPVKSDKVIINGNYNTSTSGGSLQVCQCENNAAITIAANDHLIVSDQLINNGNITVENEGNFVQVHQVNTNSGSGTFTVNRNSNLKRLDYTYWSSPVIGQNLKAFSPGTLNNRFYTYNEGTDTFEGLDPVVHEFGDGQSGFESAAKGYAIRASNYYPIGAPAPVQLFKGIFKGVPNNGSVAFPLAYQSISTGNGYNLVGNPYASNIDFYQLAENNKSLIGKTAYFWTNLNPNPSMQANNYPEAGYYNNYAVLNGTGGIPATLGASGSVKSAVPTSIIKVGQGFLVKAKQGGNLLFTNSIRTTSSNGMFFNKGAGENTEPITDRYWLHLTTSLGVTTTALIGYIAGATNQFDLDYDAELFGLGADALFTQLEDRKLGIQGREVPFLSDDIVQLGTNHYAAGSYIFSLGEKEGTFASGQNIYLKDKETGILTNLSMNSYSFTSNQGLSLGRFELKYRPETSLAVSNPLKEQVTIYRSGNEFVVQATENITALEVFDASGRLMLQFNPHQRELRIDMTSFTNGLYVLKMILSSSHDVNSSVVTKKIRK